MAAKVSSLILGLFVLANLLVKQHGQDAPIYATMRADAHRVYVL